jgi:hypothetical protein
MILSILFSILLLSCKNHDENEQQFDPDKNPFISEIEAFILETESSDLESYILVDSIQYFTGKQAVDAYFKDKGEKPDEATFYIRNEKVDSLKYLVSDTVSIELKTLDYSKGESFPDKTENFNNFMNFYNSLNKSYITHIPFRLRTVENKVVLIEEIYIP